jgi:hypothetical protein
MAVQPLTMHRCRDRFSAKRAALGRSERAGITRSGMAVVDSWQTKPPCPIGHRFQGTYGIKVKAENLFEPLVSTKITPGTMQQGQRFITIPTTYPPW